MGDIVSLFLELCCRENSVHQINSEIMFQHAIMTVDIFRRELIAGTKYLHTSSTSFFKVYNWLNELVLKPNSANLLMYFF